MEMSKHLRKIGHECAQKLNEGKEFDSDKKEAWNKLNEITLARIIMFNRRRPGEVSKVKMDEFQSRHIPNMQKVIHRSLTVVEQELCRTFERIEIAGKRGNTVPVLLNDEMRQWLEILARFRTSAGVVDSNNYLFAR